MNTTKVILISIDGMTPDAFLRCGNPYVETITKKAYYSLNAQTVTPSVTLPAHYSMFHSVPPMRHGVTTNIYTPQVRPIDGIFEQLKKQLTVNAMYYGWETIRDICRPETLNFAEYIQYASVQGDADAMLTDRLLKRVDESHPHFLFLYIVKTDAAGHNYGWNSKEYLQSIYNAIENVKKVVEHCEEEYTVILATDHGGHERMHGTELPEDMTIPIFYIGKDFPKGVRFDGGSILDIAPTVTKLMDIPPVPEWEGKPVL